MGDWDWSAMDDSGYETWIRGYYERVDYKRRKVLTVSCRLSIGKSIFHRVLCLSRLRTQQLCRESWRHC